MVLGPLGETLEGVLGMRSSSPTLLLQPLDEHLLLLPQQQELAEQDVRSVEALKQRERLESGTKRRSIPPPTLSVSRVP
jgi:hypothetical protein